VNHVLNGINSYRHIQTIEIITENSHIFSLLNDQFILNRIFNKYV